MSTAGLPLSGKCLHTPEKTTEKEKEEEEEEEFHE